MNNGSVGDIFSQGRNRAVMAFVMLAGVLVYVATIIYAEIHNISLMLKGVPEDGRFLAILGVIALGITALALPLALHFWMTEFLHKIAGFIFYGIDFALLIANVVVDYNLVSHREGQLPGWANDYLTYVVPVGPLVAGIGWSIMFLLDPSARERLMFAQLGSATRQAYARRRAAHAMQNLDYQAMVDEAANRDQMEEGRILLGYSQPPQPRPRQLPQPQQQANNSKPQPPQRWAANPPKSKASDAADGSVPSSSPATDGDDDDEEAGPENGQPPFILNAQVRQPRLKIRRWVRGKSGALKR